MSSFVEIAGKKYENVSTAAKLTGYSRDYIGRLAREKKILATQVNRQWFVFVPSLQIYAKLSDNEQKVRKQELSLERKNEREATRIFLEKKRAKENREKRKKLYSRALVVASLSFSVGLGVMLGAVSVFDLDLDNQIASAPDGGGFLRAEQEFPIATGEVVEHTKLEAIDFSNESMTIATLDADSKGILLMPSDSGQALTAQVIEDLFSDPIKIVRDLEGNSFVVRTKANGMEEQLPFAVVPVSNTEIP